MNPRVCACVCWEGGGGGGGGGGGQRDEGRQENLEECVITSPASTASSPKDGKLQSEADSITQQLGIFGTGFSQIVLRSQ